MKAIKAFLEYVSNVKRVIKESPMKDGENKYVYYRNKFYAFSPRRYAWARFVNMTIRALDGIVLN